MNIFLERNKVYRKGTYCINSEYFTVKIIVLSSACAHHAIFFTDLINTHLSKRKFRYGLMKCVWQSKKKLRGVSCFGIKKMYMIYGTKWMMIRMEILWFLPNIQTLHWVHEEHVGCLMITLKWVGGERAQFMIALLFTASEATMTNRKCNQACSPCF